MMTKSSFNGWPHQPSGVDVGAGAGVPVGVSVGDGIETVAGAGGVGTAVLTPHEVSKQRIKIEGMSFMTDIIIKSCSSQLI